MTPLDGFELLVNLAFLVGALVVGRWMLQFFDWRSGIDFKQWYKAAGHHDRAIYFAARILAVFYVVGTVIRPPL